MSGRTVKFHAFDRSLPESLRRRMLGFSNDSSTSFTTACVLSQFNSSSRARWIFEMTRSLL